MTGLLLLCHGVNYHRECKAFADGAKHLSLVLSKQRQYDGVDNMYT